MKKLTFLIFSTICLFYSAKSQELILLKTIPFKDISNVSIDINKTIYVASKEGNIVQYDSTGKEINHYSPQRPSGIALLEAWRTMNIFIFYKDLQQYIVLNRFLAPSRVASIDQEKIGFAYIATLSLDNNLWVFDNSNFSLKKYDINLQKITIETPLELILNPDVYDINLMREYQNRIYLNNLLQEVLVFDNIGNHSLTLPFKTNYFNFLREEMYFIRDNDIVFYNLYSLKERTISISQYPGVKFSLCTEKQVVLFTKDEIQILSYRR